MVANTDSEKDNNEINCRILDTTLEKYTLNCRLDDNTKYDLNNSLSVVDNDILLVNFEENSIITYGTNSSQYNYYRRYNKKKSGLNAGAIVAIILVPIVALALIIAGFTFFRRKSDKTMIEGTSSNIILPN